MHHVTDADGVANAIISGNNEFTGRGEIGRNAFDRPVRELDANRSAERRAPGALMSL